MGIDWYCDEPRMHDACYHIAIVSLNKTECQCMDCLRIWDKKPGFVSDWPQHDAG